MDERRDYRIETFDPLLRDLVAWGLVERTGTTTRPGWRMVDAAQRRLDELGSATKPMALDQLVYFDHLCADCHDRTRTRLHEGLYLCDACMKRRATEASGEAGAPKPVSRGIWRRHRHGVDGGRSLAG